MVSLPRLRIEHVYLVAALALAGFTVSLVPIVPHDFWWHMAIGRDIVQTGQIPTADRYSWALPPGTRYVYQSWLSELMLYGVHSIGGLPAVVILRNALYLLAVLVLALEAWRRSGSWRLAALAAAGVTMLSLNNLTVRPQMFSWIPFALFAALLSAFRGGRVRAGTLLLLPISMAVWTNLHGAFVLGIILIGLTAAGETAKLLAGRANALSPEHLRSLWIVLALTLAAPLANPEGIAVYGYVGTILASTPIQVLVTEWQPLAAMSLFGIIFVATIFASAWAWLRAGQPADLTDLLVWGAFLWIAIGTTRNVMWWAMLAWPMLAGHVGRRTKGGRARSIRSYANTVLALVLIALPVSVQPPWKSSWPLPANYAGLGRSVPGGTLLAAGTPVKAIAWLREHPLPSGARLFHDMGFGSYLIWALPERQVYVDPRVELYPLAEWLRYQRIAAACSYNRELQQLGITHLLLSRTGQGQLVRALERDPAWQQLYEDEYAIIYARTASS